MNINLISSRELARDFEMSHTDMIFIIDSVLDDFPELESQTPDMIEQQSSVVVDGERVYTMNRPFVSLVAMRCKTQKARASVAAQVQRFHDMLAQLTAAGVDTGLDELFAPVEKKVQP